jgi:hypothetical protein
MPVRRSFVLVMIAVPSVFGLLGAGRGTGESAPTFKADVMPIFQRHCLPCHAEESFNPSALALDDHGLLMKGGEHGAAVVPGKPDESLLMKKVTDDPPFGDRMPMRPKRRKNPDQRPTRLTEEEIGVLREWVSAGAKND